MKQINPLNNILLSKVYGKLFKPESKYYSFFFRSVSHPNSVKGKILMYVGIGDVSFVEKSRL